MTGLSGFESTSATGAKLRLNPRALSSIAMARLTSAVREPDSPTARIGGQVTSDAQGVAITEGSLTGVVDMKAVLQWANDFVNLSLIHI